MTDARLRAVLAAAGSVPTASLNKLVLYPQHGGAVLEFGSAADAGRAALAVDGLEIEGSSAGGGGSRKLRVGSVAELFKGKAEKRVDRVDLPSSSAAAGKGQDGKKATAGSGAAAASLMPPPPTVVRRPAAGTGRAGPKRLLGFVGKALPARKAGGDDDAAAAAAAAAPAGMTNGEGKGGAAGKSNADFKKMFLGGGNTNADGDANAEAKPAAAAEGEKTEGNGNKTD